MSLTKDHFIQNINKRTGIYKVQSRQMVESLFEILKENLANGEDVLISGIGKFCVKDKGRRRGRNPATGQDLMLEQRNVVRFKCSGVLKDKINGSGYVLELNNIDPKRLHQIDFCTVYSKYDDYYL